MSHFPCPTVSTILALTWNANESGTLWTREWYEQDGHFFSRVVASGVFVPPVEYEGSVAFWEAFMAHAKDWPHRVIGRAES